ncbi:MAG: hypothetical protein ACI814_005093, partial [Mariniblastus sp.]
MLRQKELALTIATFVMAQIPCISSSGGVDAAQSTAAATDPFGIDGRLSLRRKT